MPKSFSTNRTRLLLWLPFAYAFTSRYHWPRDFVVNALTAWVPGVFLTSLLGGLGAAQALGAYALGYLVFISIYELGYLANDSYGLHHDPTPRQRVDLTLRPMFLVGFVGVRLATIGVAASLLGVVGSALFWAALGTLVVTLVAHNTLRSIELKFYSFLQLSLLRFSLPVFPALVVEGRQAAVLLVLCTGLMLFSLPRFLTYLDAKGRLNLPERKALQYHLKAHLTVAPMVFLLAFISAEPAPLWCLGWLVFVQLGYLSFGKAAIWQAGGEAAS
ncbi:hypothetical protein ACXYMP_02490 [Aliiroseovarius sp. CAU 1755]